MLTFFFIGLLNNWDEFHKVDQIFSITIPVLTWKFVKSIHQWLVPWVVLEYLQQIIPTHRIVSYCYLPTWYLADLDLFGYKLIYAANSIWWARSRTENMPLIYYFNICAPSWLCHGTHQSRFINNKCQLLNFFFFFYIN